MTELPFVFAAAVAIAACLGTIAVWAPRRLLVRAGALGVFALFLPLGFAGWTDLLSRPKPVAFEWWLDRADEATVLAGTIREGAGIYVWLQLDATEEPRAYRLPWSREQAQQLQEALEEAEKNGSAVRMRLPFEASLDPREPKFYALPQPALPQKPAPNGEPQRFVQPEQEA
jgi:hypothetical protein